jgi:hypothetical protein
LTSGDPRGGASGVARTARAVLLVLVALAALVPSMATAARYADPPEDYAPYQPQENCRAHARPGTLELARWINRRFDGGRAAATIRACSSGGTSEHKDGRAVDWAMNAASKADRREVARLLDRLFDTDGAGDAHALARRMGVMYVIWNDHMYASYRQFERSDYQSSSCRTLRSCSATLRHRDHVHISLSRPGAAGRTSWYLARGVVPD